MEKKIYTIIKSICFGFLFTLPIIVLVLTMFRSGTYDISYSTSICNSFIIPFVSSTLTSLANLFEVSSTSFVILFFSYYISVFIYYLCIEILLILLDVIHYLFHYFEKRVLR